MGSPEGSEEKRNARMIAEKISEQLLADLFLINKLIDGVIDNRPIEIKSCQEFIKHHDSYAHGRFWLRKDQHEYLINNGGLYLFVVHRENGEKYILILPAVLVPFPKDRQIYTITWTRLFLDAKKTIINKNWKGGD